MATRQYIGARYVPKFADPIEWVRENSYEALTIVTYLNNSYTSKKAVPANTDITNTDYWVVTGNYNAQVEEYRKEVDKIKNNYKNSIKGRKFIFIGDSWGNGLTYESGSAEYVNSFIDIACEWLELDYYKNTVDGIGFTTSTSFTDLLASLSSQINDKNSITDIFVTGGINDLTNVDAIDNGISQFCNYAKANYVNANIHIGEVGRIIGQNMSNVISLYKNCEVNGAHYINNIENCVLLNMLGADGGHPLSNAYTKLAYSFSNYILTGFADDIETNITVTINANGTLNAGTLNMNMNVHRGNVIISLDSEYVNITLNSIPELLKPFKLGSISGQSLVRTCAKRFTLPIWVGTKNKLYPFSCFFDNGVFYGMPIALEDVGDTIILITPFNTSFSLNELY